jgi:hypothetical protein
LEFADKPKLEELGLNIMNFTWKNWSSGLEYGWHFLKIKFWVIINAENLLLRFWFGPIFIYGYRYYGDNKKK